MNLANQINLHFLTFLSTVTIDADEFRKALCPFPDCEKIDLFGLINTLINAILLIAGLIAVTFIVIGGYQYITSASDPEKGKKASKTLTWAILGLVAILSASLLVQFVIRQVKII